VAIFPAGPPFLAGYAVRQVAFVEWVTALPDDPVVVPVVAGAKAAARRAGALLGRLCPGISSRTRPAVHGWLGDRPGINRVSWIGSGPVDVGVEVVVDEFFVRVKAVHLTASDQENVGAERREIIAAVVVVVLDCEGLLLLLFRFEPLSFA
jgi:hypothetical protein